MAKVCIVAERLVRPTVFGEFVPFLFSLFLCWGHVLRQGQVRSSNDHAGKQSVRVPVTQQHGCKDFKTLQHLSLYQARFPSDRHSVTIESLMGFPSSSLIGVS